MRQAWARVEGHRVAPAARDERERCSRAMRWLGSGGTTSPLPVEVSKEIVTAQLSRASSSRPKPLSQLRRSTAAPGSGRVRAGSASAGSDRQIKDCRWRQVVAGEGGHQVPGNDTGVGTLAPVCLARNASWRQVVPVGQFLKEVRTLNKNAGHWPFSLRTGGAPAHTGRGTRPRQ